MAIIWIFFVEHIFILLESNQRLTGVEQIKGKWGGRKEAMKKLAREKNAEGCENHEQKRNVTNFFFVCTI
jgi:hypothetical protein